MTLEESLAQIRLLCGHPMPEKPGDPQLLTLLRNATQLLHVRVQNSTQAWDVSNFQLLVSPGVSDYIVPASMASAAKDVLILTQDQSDPYHVARRIERCDLQDIPKFYQGPAQDITSLTHSAVVMSFYRKDNNTAYIKVTPTPSQAATYLCWMETGEPAMTALADSPTLVPFQRFRNLKAAIQVLPLCEWAGMDARAMRDRRQELAVAMSRQEAEWESAFNIWIQNDRQPAAMQSPVYGSWY